MAIIRLAKERKILEGDISQIQYESLQYLLIKNIERENKQEEERQKVLIMATNPQLYKAIFMDKNPDEEGINWYTPKSVEEADELARILSGN